MHKINKTEFLENFRKKYDLNTKSKKQNPSFEISTNTFLNPMQKRYEQNLVVYDMNHDPQDFERRILYNKENWAPKKKNEKKELQNFDKLSQKFLKTKRKKTKKDKIIPYMIMGGDITQYVKNELNITPTETESKFNVFCVKTPRDKQTSFFLSSEFNGEFLTKLNLIQSLHLSVLVNRNFHKNDFVLALIVPKIKLSPKEIVDIIRLRLYKKFGFRSDYFKKSFVFDDHLILSTGDNWLAYDYILKMNETHFNIINEKYNLSMIEGDYDLPSLNVSENFIEEKYGTDLEKSYLSKLTKEKILLNDWHLNLMNNWNVKNIKNRNIGALLMDMQSNGIELGIYSPLHKMTQLLDDDEQKIYEYFDPLLANAQFFGSIHITPQNDYFVTVKKYIPFEGYLFGSPCFSYNLTNYNCFLVEDPNCILMDKGPTDAAFRIKYDDDSSDNRFLAHSVEIMDENEFDRRCRQTGAETIKAKKPETENVKKPETKKVVNPDSVDLIKGDADLNDPKIIKLIKPDAIDLMYFNMIQKKNKDFIQKKNEDFFRPENEDFIRPENEDFIQKKNEDFFQPENEDFFQPENEDFFQKKNEDFFQPENEDFFQKKNEDFFQPETIDVKKPEIIDVKKPEKNDKFILELVKRKRNVMLSKASFSTLANGGRGVKFVGRLFPRVLSAGTRIVRLLK